ENMAWSNLFDPNVQYCPKCDWVSAYLIYSDILFLSHCEKCNTELKPKPLSKCNLKQKAYIKLFRIN
ncbi:hypothetical protein, partial [Avibacterium paragallinarum]